jgi:hypothetical protein
MLIGLRAMSASSIRSKIEEDQKGQLPQGVENDHVIVR